MSDSAKKRCLNTNKIWTKPEQEFKKLLNECGFGVKFPDKVKINLGLLDDINPTIYFQYPFQRYICDFVEPDKKIIFRVNGDYWHRNPIIYTDKLKLTKSQINNLHHDKNRKIYLENNGYFICEIWENDIQNNRDFVKSKINQVLKSS